MRVIISGCSHFKFCNRFFATSTRCIDFRGGLINLRSAAGTLLSPECGYLLIKPFPDGKLMKEDALSGHNIVLN